MDVKYSLNNITFEWDSQKAAANLRKHSIPFELACDAFFDPFICYLDDETIDGELREAIMGLSTNWQLLFVVYIMRDEKIRIISARLVTNIAVQKSFFQAE